MLHHELLGIMKNITEDILTQADCSLRTFFDYFIYHQSFYYNLFGQVVYQPNRWPNAQTLHPKQNFC